MKQRWKRRVQFWVLNTEWLHTVYEGYGETSDIPWSAR